MFLFSGFDFMYIVMKFICYIIFFRMYGNILHNSNTINIFVLGCDFHDVRTLVFPTIAW